VARLGYPDWHEWHMRWREFADRTGVLIVRKPVSVQGVTDEYPAMLVAGLDAAVALVSGTEPPTVDIDRARALGYPAQQRTRAGHRGRRASRRRAPSDAVRARWLDRWRHEPIPRRSGRSWDRCRTGPAPRARRLRAARRIHGFRRTAHHSAREGCLGSWCAAHSECSTEAVPPRRGDRPSDHPSLLVRRGRGR